jgi:hypothetical protein
VLKLVRGIFKKVRVFSGTFSETKRKHIITVEESQTVETSLEFVEGKV